MLRKISCAAGYGLLLTLSLAAAEPGVKVQIAGGTVPAMAPRSYLRLDLTAPESLVFHLGQSDLAIAYRKINTLEYGQNVSRRYAAAVLISPVLLLSKSRRHFVTLGYVDEEGKQQALVIRVEKGDIRSVLVGLEARTGRRIEYQDGEARKAGKG
jgi:hypothetical protein